MTHFAAIILAVASLFPSGEGPPDAVPAPPTAVTALELGAEGTHVARLQRRLTAAGFRPGETDGRFGGATHQAVLAFQKHHGLERDGVFRPSDWALLSERPTVRARSEADRIEIDLDRQVLYYVTANRVEFVLPVSSGNGGTFTNYAGNQVRARTPEGRFEFYFERPYHHTSYLGAMYKPYYFRGGYAIHGSPSVPPWPASHGCIRVTNTDMDFLRTHLELGMAIYVYGLRTPEPAGLTGAGPSSSYAA